MISSNEQMQEFDRIFTTVAKIKDRYFLQQHQKRSHEQKDLLKVIFSLSFRIPAKKKMEIRTNKDTVSFVEITMENIHLQVGNYNKFTKI